MESVSGEKIKADIYVFCKNVNEGPMLILPVYGQTLVKKSESEPYSVIDSETRIVHNVLGGNLRVSHGAIVRTNNKDAVKDLYLPNIGENWEEILTNSRPVTPDSLPIICKDKKINNLFYNGGHGFLGWSLSFVSAKILYDVISNKENDYTKWLGDRFF